LTHLSISSPNVSAGDRGHPSRVAGQGI